MRFFSNAKNMNLFGSLIAIMIFSFFGNNSFAMGEKNKAELNNLWSGLKNMLIKNGHCNSAEDCFRRIPIYGEGGDRVNLNIYGPASRESILAILDFVAREGINITNGTPITIQVFPKEKKEYVNSVVGHFSKPKIKLEVNE